MYIVYVVTLYKWTEKRKAEFMRTRNIANALECIAALHNFTICSDYITEYVTMEYAPAA